MAMNSLQKALVEAGLAKEPKERKRKGKEFKCNKCGEVMTNPDGINVMYCKNCNTPSYFIFTNGK